jgi:hypothetical protein
MRLLLVGERTITERLQCNVEGQVSECHLQPVKIFAQFLPMSALRKLSKLTAVSQQRTVASNVQIES